jgi:class 3 adenylate cyclase
VDLPRGTVTYLFTDVQGSTRLWEQAPELMMTALEMHDRIIDRAAVENGGVSVKPRGEGDSHFLVFTSASDAVNAAADIQRRLDATDWPTLKPLQVRIALHTGVAEVRSGDYYGTAVNRAARLRAIAHGSQTVASAATWELIKDSLPAGITVTDLGRHGLKDLSRPEHVFQIDVDGLVNDFPALKSLEATPNNLPVQLTALVGREREIADVEQALNRDRFITILAPGGTGKTRLAIETAARLVSEFPDGVFFVDLAPISSTDGIAQAIFESIGVRLAAGDDMRAQLLVYLAGKSQLLVLDNFEHLIAGVDIVTDMLGAAPNIKIIVTSRERLRVSGETVLTLTGLDATWGSDEEALETGSVQLFVEAARRTDQAFALNVEDMESLGRIVRLVEGMPLGIILAAAWVDTLGVGEIAHQIANTLDFLESDRRDTPDRHKSMRALFDYSLALLPEEERSTLLTLSIFRGGFDAGCTICDRCDAPHVGRFGIQIAADCEP